MKTAAYILIGVGIICYVIAIISKATGIGLYDMGIQPLATLVFGNSCLLLALVIYTIKSD